MTDINDMIYYFTYFCTMLLKQNTWLPNGQMFDLRVFLNFQQRHKYMTHMPVVFFFFPCCLLSMQCFQYSISSFLLWPWTVNIGFSLPGPSLVSSMRRKPNSVYMITFNIQQQFRVLVHLKTKWVQNLQRRFRHATLIQFHKQGFCFFCIIKKIVN